MTRIVSFLIVFLAATAVRAEDQWYCYAATYDTADSAVGAWCFEDAPTCEEALASVQESPNLADSTPCSPQKNALVFFALELNSGLVKAVTCMTSYFCSRVLDIFKANKDQKVLTKCARLTVSAARKKQAKLEKTHE